MSRPRTHRHIRRRPAVGSGICQLDARSAGISERRPRRAPVKRGASIASPGASGCSTWRPSDGKSRRVAARPASALRITPSLDRRSTAEAKISARGRHAVPPPWSAPSHEERSRALGRRPGRFGPTRASVAVGRGARAARVRAQGQRRNSTAALRCSRARARCARR